MEAARRDDCVRALAEGIAEQELQAPGLAATQGEARKVVPLDVETRVPYGRAEVGETLQWSGEETQNRNEFSGRTPLSFVERRWYDRVLVERELSSVVVFRCARCGPAHG